MAVKRVEVVINSRKYTVLADETEEYINKLADHINEKVKLVLGSGQNVIGERPVILAALNICDEYFKCQEAGKMLSEQLVAQNEKLELANKTVGELESANKAVLEHRNSNPQISFEEEEAILALDKAKARIKELEEQVASLKNNRSYNNSKNQNNRPYNNSYNNRHNR